MNITVILCTYNRGESLATVLDCLSRQDLPRDVGCEILVLDNNSNDRTPAVVADYVKRFPGRFRYLLESRPGKSNALNSGIRESQGDVLAFIDDDVLVEPNWLHNLTAPLNLSDWVGSGGPVILKWSCSQPRWLPLDGRYSLAPLAGFDPGKAAGPLDEPPFGTNMAFRRTMFAKYGTFRTDLGPSPKGETPRPNEDTEFGQRLIDGGERLFYEPSAVVFHPVPESRLQQSYFLDWWFDKGRAETRAFGVPREATKICGVPVLSLRRFVAWNVRWMFAARPRRRFDSKLKVWTLAGEILESRRISRQSNIAAREAAR